MKKYQMIILFFGLGLLLKADLGIALILPSLLYHLHERRKDFLWMVIGGAVSCFFLNVTQIAILSSIYLASYGYEIVMSMVKVKKIKKDWIITLAFMLCLMLLFSFFIPALTQDISIKVILMVLSLLSYLFFCSSSPQTSFHQITRKSFYSIYIYLLSSIYSCLGFFSIEIYTINLGLVIAFYYAVNYIRKYKSIETLIYSFFLSVIAVFLFQKQEGYFIFPLSLVFSFTGGLPLILDTIILMGTLFVKNELNEYVIYAFTACLLIVEVECIVFEKNIKTKIAKKEDYYDYSQKKIVDETLAFASFLDSFSSVFSTPKEYNEKISDGIKQIVQSHCMHCLNRKECFEKNRSRLYPVFRDILLNEQTKSLDDFKESCDKVPFMQKTALKKTDEIKNAKKEIGNAVLVSQLMGVSNALKKYTMDLSSKELENIDLFWAFKEEVLHSGINLAYYEVIRTYKDDFLIYLGTIENDCCDEPKLIELAKTCFNQEISVKEDKVDHNHYYYYILPKIKYDLMYGYGAITCEGYEICGDNYMIKEKNNGHFVCAISDGMGKGYSAFTESEVTLKLINQMMDLNLESSTSLEILNSFYSVQGYLDRYATLDFLDINRHTGIGNIYKLGASTSYVLRKNKMIDQIKNQALPFGMDDSITSLEYPLEEGDLIIMSSDGIFENILDEHKLQDFIENIRDYPPQKIVYEILNYAVHANLKVKDDMSVIVVKVEERKPERLN